MEGIPKASSLIKTIYKEKGYLDEYGGSVFVTIIVCLVFFIAISYFKVMANINPIKKNWPNERCDPSVIPFAGLINKGPQDTVLGYTGKNFSGCVNNILIDIAQDVLKPIHYLMNTIENTGKDLSDAVNAVRAKISDMLGEITSISTEIMGRILNFLMPVHKMMAKMMSLMKKTQGTLVTAMYGVISGYLGVHSFVGAFIDILIIFLVMLASLILPLLFFFFTIPLAIPPLIIFALIAGFTTVVIIGLSDVLHMTESSVPPKPRCFDKNTIIMKKGNVPCKIPKIKIGDELNDGSIVTETFKLSSHQMNMYDVNGIIVSGNHYVLHKEGMWITVSDLSDVIKLEDYREEFIYCFNTNTKIIRINNKIFTDWDSLDDIDIHDIKVKCNEFLPSDFEYKNIHKYLVGGFLGNTMLELDNGQSVSIQDIKVNDVMRFSDRILGKVVIDATDLDVRTYTINEQEFICGPNNLIVDDDIGIKTTLCLKGKKLIEQPNKLFHLITDTGLIIINGTQFTDYDGSLEHFQV